MADGVVNLKGKNYKTVALRVTEFRAKYPPDSGWSLTTTFPVLTERSVMCRAAITNPEGREIAVGHAEEFRSSSGVNSTSAVENCETSAIGRALAAAGYGGSEYASADELANKLQRQAEREQQRQERQQQGQGQRDSKPDSAASSLPASHHESWKADHKWFCGIALNQERGLKYDDVAAWCEKKGFSRPSTWENKDRRAFVEDLDAGRYPDLYTPPVAAEAR